jgi:hypothetical protein
LPDDRTRLAEEIIGVDESFFHKQTMTTEFNGSAGQFRGELSKKKVGGNEKLRLNRHANIGEIKNFKMNDDS